MANVPQVLLSSGYHVPLVGMGTAGYHLDASESSKLPILGAIEIGYRHFDTAAVYQSEQHLGKAIAEALRLGLIKSRDELFITSKLWCSDAHPHLVLPALRTTLRNLQLEYLDLYLIHHPVSSTPGRYDFPIKEELLPMDFKSVWAAMEECQRLGLTKSIGVSNFSCKKLESLLAVAKIPPAVNQVCLRWVYEQGVGLLVKSCSERRLEENLDIFNWALSEEESEKIGQIPQRRGLSGEVFVSENGPFNSVEDFWDGEV
uniref:NADP-dependent oxidoreductase domain-containing protein n=1 Tax=Nelumbo nucifera TaxID=4432 RepID=A0A822YTG4_NELNU|nr:TPA_asm: hypothetical protein HUJ06_005339 [Nelumbo nucifera]